MLKGISDHDHLGILSRMTGNELRQQAKAFGIPMTRHTTKAEILDLIRDRRRPATSNRIPEDIIRALRICHRDSSNAAKTIRAYIDGLLNGTHS